MSAGSSAAKLGEQVGRLSLPLVMGLLVLLVVAGSAPGAVSGGPILGVRARVHAIALKAGGDYSDAALERAAGQQDFSVLSLYRRLVDQGAVDLAAARGQAAQAAAEPVLTPQTLGALSPEAARLINASIPFSSQPILPARTFRLSPGEDRDAALDCLAKAVYYEAAFESAEGQAAVAQVVLNRLRHPLYPKTVCGVVFQGSHLSTGCQFTFTCDGALANAPVPWAWAQARSVAERALSGHVANFVGHATHYHAGYVVPYWIPSLTKITQVGSHIFYRWSGGMGLPAAFSGAYRGGERLVLASLSQIGSSPVEPELNAAEVEAKIGLVIAKEEAAVPEIAPPAPKVELAQLEIAASPQLQAPSAPIVAPTRPAPTASRAALSRSW